MLHDRVRAELASRYTAALRVLDRHQPDRAGDDPDGWCCVRCSGRISRPWPCEEIRDLLDVLGVEVPDALV